MTALQSASNMIQTALPVPEPVRFRSGPARLIGVLHQPLAHPKAAVVLHGATGVPQSYYQAFAAWLAETQGLACLTYDYRDMAASACSPARSSSATLADWGAHDQAAAQSWLEERLPGVPIWVIGHSLGGFMLPFQPGAGRLARLIVVGSGLTHTSDHPWPFRALVHLFWHGHVPLIVRAVGHLPGRLSGFGQDLPAGVYWQWRKWCTDRAFFYADIGRSLPAPDMAAIVAPAHFVAIADDPMAPPAAVWRAMALYPNSVKSQRVIRPDPGQTVGHIGIFARRNAELWPDILPPEIVTADDRRAAPL